MILEVNASFCAGLRCENYFLPPARMLDLHTGGVFENPIVSGQVISAFLLHTRSRSSLQKYFRPRGEELV